MPRTEESAPPVLPAARDIPVNRRDTLPGALIEVVPLGHRVVLRNRQTGATILSNDQGVHILEAVLRFESRRDRVGTLAGRTQAPEMPDGAIAATIESWEAAGLFATGARDRAPLPRLRSHDLPQTTAVFALGPHAFRLTSEDAAVFEDCATLMAAYRAKPDGPWEAELSVHVTDGGLEVTRDGHPVWRPCSRDEARFLVLQQAQGLLLGMSRVAAVLHAAAVIRDGYALVFAGASNQGKSTLALALTEAGWHYAGDDLVALDADGRHVLPLPFAANCKTPEARAVFADLGRSESRATRPGHFLWPERLAEAGRPVRVAGLIFPAYSPGDGFEATPMEAEAALARLLRTGSEVVGPANSLAPMARLITSVPNAAWLYGETRSALAAAERALQTI